MGLRVHEGNGEGWLRYGSSGAKRKEDSKKMHGKDALENDSRA
jgi:hypothetical protein